MASQVLGDESSLYKPARELPGFAHIDAWREECPKFWRLSVSSGFYQCLSDSMSQCSKLKVLFSRRSVSDKDL